MSTLSLAQINAAVDAAYQTALANPARVAPGSIGDNATLRTDVYTGPNGAGFAVAATVDLKFRTLTMVRQHGPETWREKTAPALAELVAEARAERAARYQSEASAYDLADAETKISSADAAMQAEGTAQKAAVLAKRLQIKTDIPLPL